MPFIGVSFLKPSVSLNEHLFYFCKLSVNLNVKVRGPDVNMSDSQYD